MLRAFYTQFYSEFGPQNWWPARTRLEVIVGAILVQNTAWQNASLALKRLRACQLLSLARLRLATLPEIEKCVRPAGFFRQKARTIKNFLEWLETSFEGSLDKLFALPALEARALMLEINGLGPETVDGILLYAGNMPFFVADSYTRRVLSRHELVRPVARYEDVQSFLHRHLPADPGLFNEYHALLVELGKRYCTKTAPNCPSCPLEGFLGPSQPVNIPAATFKRGRGTPPRGQGAEGG